MALGILNTVLDIAQTGADLYNQYTRPQTATSPQPPPLTAGNIVQAGGAVTAMSMIPAGSLLTPWVSRRILSLVRTLGIAGTADALGTDTATVANAVVRAVSRRRRSRGISARDLRVTRRTTRRLITAARDLSKLKTKCR